MVKVAEFGMTRRKEIIAEAKKHEYDWGVDVDRFDVPDIFAKGAEWMQEIMIEKACEWLKNKWREYVYQDGDGIVHFGHWENDFRKAMEEQL